VHTIELGIESHAIDRGDTFPGSIRGATFVDTSASCTLSLVGLGRNSVGILAAP
jgi:hypothetical protein